MQTVRETALPEACYSLEKSDKADDDDLRKSEVNTKQPLRQGCGGSVGVKQERGMHGEKHARTWEALNVPEARTGRLHPNTQGWPKTIRESDRPTLL